jgi:hypothetical protein
MATASTHPGPGVLGGGGGVGDGVGDRVGDGVGDGVGDRVGGAPVGGPIDDAIAGCGKTKAMVITIPRRMVRGRKTRRMDMYHLIGIGYKRRLMAHRFRYRVIGAIGVAQILVT